MEMFLLLLFPAFFHLTVTHRPPNIVFILTDDQDATLGGMTPLSAARHLIGDEGTTFLNAFATTPICCPSRSSILTGLYLHGHGTVNNSLSGGCSDRRWQTRHEPRTFAAILRKAGYRTFYGGKYLNKYGSLGSGGVGHVPPGWDWWVGLVGNSVYYNYTLSVNGSGVERGDRESDYLTDVLRHYSLEFLKDRSRLHEPFLMVVAPPAPHEPFTPAERHRGVFKHLKAPRTPSFNLPVNGTKHWLLRLPPRVLPPDTVDRIDRIFRDRWETLLSVDELISGVVSTLREIGLLDDTYVMLSSDHGFHLGQFGLPWDKRQPYETDVRIPLLLRGPGVLKRVSEVPVLNVDFAATILDMAGLSRGRYGDGKSFLRASEEERTFLIEYRGESGGSKECTADEGVRLCLESASCKCFDGRNNTYSCVRRIAGGDNDIFCRFEDEERFEEFYDVSADPHEMRNLLGDERVRERRRMLKCAREKMESKRAVDECFES